MNKKLIAVTVSALALMGLTGCADAEQEEAKASLSWVWDNGSDDVKDQMCMAYSHFGPEEMAEGLTNSSITVKPATAEEFFGERCANR